MVTNNGCKTLKVDYADGTLHFQHLEGVWVSDMALRLSLGESITLLEQIREEICKRRSRRIINVGCYELDIATYDCAYIQIYASEYFGEMNQPLGDFRYDSYVMGTSIANGLGIEVLRLNDERTKREQENGNNDYYKVLKIEYSDSLVFKHLQGPVYVIDTTLNLTKSESITLLAEIREAMRDRKDRTFIAAGRYDLTISTYDCRRMQISILEHSGEMSRPLGEYGYDRYIQGKSVLEGLTAAISVLSREEEE